MEEVTMLTERIYCKFQTLNMLWGLYIYLLTL